MSGNSNNIEMPDTAGAGGWATENDMIMDAPGVFRYSPMPQIVQYHHQSPYGPYHGPIRYDLPPTVQAPPHGLRVQLAQLHLQQASGQLFPDQNRSTQGTPSHGTSMAALSPQSQHVYQLRPASPRSYVDVARLPVQRAQRRLSGEQTINPALLSQPQRNYAHSSSPLPPQLPTWAERFEQAQPQPGRSNGQNMHLAPPSPGQAHRTRQYDRRRSIQSKSPRQLLQSNVPVQPDQLAYRLDMRDDTPLAQYVPSHPSNATLAFNAGGFEHPDRAELMAGWLGDNRTGLEEGMVGSPTDMPMSPASLRMLRSRAPSVTSAQSERSGSNRRIRRERHQRHRCAECPESFPHAERLKKHIEHVHKGYEYRPYACALCWKRWWYPKDLDRHQETHKPSDQRQGQHRCDNEGCEWSVKGFARKDGLTRHKATCSHSRSDSGIAGIPMSRTTTTQTHSTRA